VTGPRDGLEIRPLPSHARRENWFTLDRPATGQTAAPPSSTHEFQSMLNALPIGNTLTVAVLIGVSFIAFLLGEIFRKWPEKIEALTANIDGYALFLSPAANRAMIVQSGAVLVGLSFATLLLAMWLL
jgi:hypothetical protein